MLKEVFPSLYATIEPAIPDLILIVSLVVLAVVGIKIIDHITSRIRSRGGDQLRVKLYSGLIEAVFVTVILIIMLSRVGLTEDFIKLVGLVVGGIVAFSSTSLIINLVGSAIIHLTKPFRLGDIIQINEFQGKVKDVTPIYTVIQTFHKTIVNIPNSSFLKDNITNFSKEGFRTSAKVSLGYDLDHEKVESVLSKAAKFVHLEDVFVSIIELKDHAVVYEVNGTTHEPEAMPFIASRLRKAVIDQCHLAKFEVASPLLISTRNFKKAMAKTSTSKVNRGRQIDAAKTQKIVNDTFSKQKVKAKKKGKSK